jgi:peroxiredoxin
MFCREQAAQLKTIYTDVKKLGIDMVSIGNGTVFMAEDFVEQFAIPFPVYTDENRVTYDLMNLHRGLGIGFKTLKAGLSITKSGVKQGRTQGDVWQQGGEALFAKGGTLLWRHANKNADEHTQAKDLLSILKAHYPSQD